MVPHAPVKTNKLFFFFFNAAYCRESYADYGVEALTCGDVATWRENGGNFRELTGESVACRRKVAPRRRGSQVARGRGPDPAPRAQTPPPAPLAPRPAIGCAESKDRRPSGKATVRRPRLGPFEVTEGGDRLGTQSFPSRF